MNDHKHWKTHAAPPTRCAGLAISTVPAGGLEEPVLDFVASDETLDRAGETIDPRGWELAAYRRNPVFLNSHHHGDIQCVLGRAEQVEVREAEPGREGPHLRLRVRFAVAANPVAALAYALYREGYLRAVSVGFTPLAWVEGPAAKPARRRHVRQELLEVSAVAIPANPNALALACRAGAATEEAAQEVLAWLDGLRLQALHRMLRRP